MPSAARWEMFVFAHFLTRTGRICRGAAVTEERTGMNQCQNICLDSFARSLWALAENWQDKIWENRRGARPCTLARSNTSLTHTRSNSYTDTDAGAGAGMTVKLL